MSVPSRGEDAPGRSQRPPSGGRALPRAQGARHGRIPAGLEPPAAAEEASATRWPGSALHLPSPRRSRGSPPPPPRPPPRRALCYSPTSCLRPPDPGSLPGPGSRRRPRVSRRLRARSAPPPAAPNPTLGLGARAGPLSREAGVAGGTAGGTARAPLPSTRGRCAAAGLLPDRDRRHPARHGVSPSWPWGPPGRFGEGAAGCEFSDRLCRAELSPAPGPLS